MSDFATKCNLYHNRQHSQYLWILDRLQWSHHRWRSLSDPPALAVGQHFNTAREKVKREKTKLNPGVYRSDTVKSLVSPS